MKNEQTISVIMPVHNGDSTLRKTLESLFAESKKFDELIVVDDASSDGSVQTIKEYLDRKQNFVLIQNEEKKGLAAAYNKGIRAATGDLVVTLHQDILLEKEALEKLVEPFIDEKVVASAHVVTHPLEIWNKYNFWQKCFFARLAGKDFSGIDGKFDCFRKSALEKVGLFDEVHFRTAGEDGDMVYKLKKIGKAVDTEAKIIHLHKIDPRFSWKDIIHKQAQYSEAQGALLARGKTRGIRLILKSFFREVLLIALLVPYLRILSVFLLVVYSFLYTKPVFLKEYKNPRILILPFFNIYLLFVSFVFSLRGFFYGKQKI
ncbi:MAG: glycosyltransferase family 2 protein [Candidatus Moranbacteria bacterium]|nr:glycosyltransferase family 2 protein [Candidatus Moranbacteria bacterium]